MNPKSGTNLLARQAKEVRNYRVMKRVIPIILTCLAVVIVLLYVVSVMYTKFGSFTVSVNKFHQLQYGLSLSEYSDFRKPTSSLQCRAAEEVTNIDWKKELPDDLGCEDGVANGDNYLCYTFYCKNAGQEIVDYVYSIVIVNMTLDIEQAIRVRLQTNRNGEDFTRTDYARAAGVDANGNTVPEPETEPFLSKATVMETTVKDFAPGEICKYTVVVWLQGDDPECLDNIIGGEFKIDMKFTVSAVAGEAI